jgi:RNA polymerase sigma-70 factor (ECF subfamily)
MAEKTEEQHKLIRAAVAGDKTALQRLLLMHYGSIEASVRSRLGDHVNVTVDAEDVIQDALVKVCRYLGRYQEHEHDSFKAWLRSIATSCVVDAVRRSQRLKRGGEARRVHIRPSSAEESLDSIWDWVCHDSQLPERTVRREEARHAIQVCLSELPAAQREAVVAHYFQHLSTAEIAARMQRTPGAVRELLRRARENLRELMGSASAWLSGG